MAYSSVLIICLAAGSLSAPAEEPLRVELPVFEHPDTTSDSDSTANQLPLSNNLYDEPESPTNLAQPLEPENYGPDSREKTPDFLVSKLKPVVGTQEIPTGSINVQGGRGWLASPISTLEGALLEKEGLGSKVISTKDNLHNFAAGIFQPKPIVDTIKEEEKYGNNGDKFYRAGKAIVGGAENVSTFVSSVLEVPGTIIRKFARIASEKLNNLGGLIIGL